MEINFKANLIETQNVKKYNHILKRYLPKEVAFVNLEHTNTKDLHLLKNLSKEWDNTFANDVYKEARQYKYNYYTFALTTKKDNYDELTVDNILGITQISLPDENSCILEYLQVNPEFINDEEYLHKKYKHIGTAIINSIKKIIKDKKIKLYSTASSEDFYLKNDFKAIPDTLNQFYWQRSIKY